MKRIDALRRIRQERRLSIRGLAERAGVSYVTLARIETGVYDPRLSTLQKLAKALKVNVAQVIGDQPFQPLTSKGDKYGLNKTKGRVLH